jgi:hypothetical protein
MPGQKTPNNGQATPNGNKPDETQPESGNTLGDANGIEGLEDPGKFNPGLFCVSFFLKNLTKTVSLANEPS